MYTFKRKRNEEFLMPFNTDINTLKLATLMRFMICINNEIMNINGLGNYNCAYIRHYFIKLFIIVFNSMRKC